MTKIDRRSYWKEYRIKNKDRIKEYQKKRRQSPEYKEWFEKYKQTPQYKKHIKNPEYKRCHIENMAEYRKQWAKDNPEKIREAHKKWAEKNPEKIRKSSERYREKYPEKIRESQRNNRYNGMAVKVLKRDNNECQICGRKKFLHIHHFNKNKKDNRYWNLLTLCASCHKLTHLGYF